MRERYEVETKYRELRDRHLKERKEKYLGRQPINCESNVMLRLKGRGQFRFCQNPVVLEECSKKAFLCQDVETACKCPYFKCKNTEESVEEDFNKVLKEPARCGSEYPKLAMLIWFLQDYVVNTKMKRLIGMFKMTCRGIWNIVSLRWW